MVSHGNICIKSHLSAPIKHWTLTEGRELARTLDCGFFETSAKHDLNIDEAFIQLVQEIQKCRAVRTYHTIYYSYSFSLSLYQAPDPTANSSAKDSEEADRCCCSCVVV